MRKKGKEKAGEWEKVKNGEGERMRKREMGKWEKEKERKEGHWDTDFFKRCLKVCKVQHSSLGFAVMSQLLGYMTFAPDDVPLCFATEVQLILFPRTLLWGLVAFPYFKWITFSFFFFNF